MIRNGSIRLLTAVLALSGLATSAHAQQVSEAHIRELIKQAAAGVAISAQAQAMTPANSP